MKAKTIEQLVFGAAMAAVDVMGLISGFAPIWSGVSQSLPFANWIALATSVASLAGGPGCFGGGHRGRPRGCSSRR